MSGKPNSITADRRAGHRNVNGEGNIRQRRDGRWEGRAWVLTTDGKEIRRSVYGMTWQEAHDKLSRSTPNDRPTSVSPRPSAPSPSS